jgi:predicted pyridoxine 5'-phosphate oxidase superfamily flavin-nucleotide-binding protein
MTAFYTDSQQKMQAAFGAEKLAQTVQNAIVWDVVEGPNVDFIESRDFFFLSTVDAHGRPTVSYKGGPTGVVKVLDDKTLIFPIYDGNGMFLSAGNMADTSKVGLLFIDFETPNRVRVQGDATISSDDPELARWPGAKMVVRVAVESCFLNCARYIHKHQRIEASPYVPKDDGSQPHPSWKRIDFVQEALSNEDQARTRETGEITMDDYVEHLMEGRS